MARPLIATKLYLPRLRRSLVARPRLLEKLRQGAEAKLTLVCAPAGFGKTTLVAEWLAEPPDGGSVAWLSLDRADNEPASFWIYLVTALRSAVPDVGSSALELLAASPVSAELVLTTVLNELASVFGDHTAAQRDVWLVLDDYHLIDDREIGTAMAFLLEHLPAGVHLVLSTRADPELPLSRWRARGELVEIRARDLRFTFDEATAYLNGVTGLDLPAGAVAVLEDRTEGWIAAIQLAALSLQGRDDVSGFIARFAGDDRYIVDYLVEEVLQHQPAVVRDFLLQTAVLDRFTGSLCDAVTGRDDATGLLAMLERANLFLVGLDDRREWFRYHHLFADVLRARLLAEQPDLVPRLHQRASRWYETNDFTEEAVGHAIAARDFNRASHLLELAVPAIRRHRQEAMMHRWLTSLPDDTVRGSPVLSVFYGSMLMASGNLDAVEARLDDAERAMNGVPPGAVPPWADTQELRTLPATIAVYRAALAQARGDVAGTAAYARRALDLAGPDDHLARGGAAGFLGLAAWAAGDVPAALETFSQAVASLHAAGNLVDELSSTVIVADLLIAIGRRSTARRLYEKALQHAEAHGAPVARATADLHVGVSELDLDDGDPTAAVQHLEAAAAIRRGAPMAESRYRWFVAMSRVAEGQGDPTEAIRLLDEAERAYLPGFFPDVRPISAMRARVWIATGQLKQAADWAWDRGVSTADEADYLREFDHLTLVRLLIALHDPDTLEPAAGLLDRLHHAADRAGRTGSLPDIELMQTLVCDAQRNAAKISIAATARSVDPRDNPAPQSLSHRELQVLRLLAGEQTGPQIARELFVTHNTLRTHTKHIFTKLDVTNRRAAVRRARERGLM